MPSPPLGPLSFWMAIFVQSVCEIPSQSFLPHLLLLLLVNGAMTAICLGISSLAKTADQATVVLDEERLNVQKREVDAGGVLITKDVETRQANQPVELQREEVQIERLSPEQARERDLAAN